MNECYNCGFNDEDYGCTCPHSDKWYACPIEAKKEENIQALTQEPCGDTISRKAVLDIIDFEDKWLLDTKSHNADTNIAFMAIKSKISELASVKPQPRTGGWIEHFDEIGKWYECDQCHTDWGGSVNYCPNCGCKMGV